MSGQRSNTPPLLVLLDTRSANPFSSYIREILDIEGFFVRDVVDLTSSAFPDAALESYDTVLLANIELPVPEQDLLRQYVSGGGNLIALKPPKGMADLFGLRPSNALANTRVKDRYVVLSQDHDLSSEVPCGSLQFHGDMDLYIPEDADVLAYAAGDLDEPSGFAAIITRRAGRGRVAAFAYDLATCVVRMHQGRPQNASTGTNPDPDGDDRWAPNDLFIGQLDARLKYLPQADIHQDLLVRILNWMGEGARPIPRVWYFPDAAPGVAYFNGDSDGMVRESYDTVRTLVEDHGGVFTLYLLEEHYHHFRPKDMHRLREQGHAFGHHSNLPLQVLVDNARQELDRSFACFERAYGFRPLTHRGHCLVWPGWTEMASTLASNGVRMDQSYIPRRFLQHGYLNGSGLPVRFMSEDGELLDNFEQNTHITDDGSVEADKFLIPTGSQDDVMHAALRMLDDCFLHFHGVFQAAFHPQLTVQRALWLLTGLLTRCRELGIPMVSGDAWVRFNEGRRKLRFDDVTWDRGSGSFNFRVSAEVPVQGLTLMVPAHVAGAAIASVAIDGTPLSFSIRRLKGMLYTLFVVNFGDGVRVAVDVMYGTNGRRSKTPEEGAARVSSGAVNLPERELRS